MSEASLRKSLLNLLLDINKQQEAVLKAAKENNTNPYDLRHADGSFVLTPLLVARADALNALAHLRNN